MPARFTIDKNGFVVAVESVSALKAAPLPTSGRNSGETKKPKRKVPSPTPTKVAKRPQIICRICGAKFLSERNFDYHRRKLHASDIEELPSANKVARKASKKAKKRRNKPLSWAD